MILVWKHKGFVIVTIAIAFLLLVFGWVLLTAAMRLGEIALWSLHTVGVVLATVLLIAVTFWALLYATVPRLLRADERGVTFKVGRWKPRILWWQEITEVRHGTEAFYEGRGAWSTGYALTLRSESRWKGIRVTEQRFREQGEFSLSDFSLQVSERALSRGIPVTVL